MAGKSNRQVGLCCCKFGLFLSAALVLTGDPLPDGNFAFSTVLCDSPAFFGDSACHGIREHLLAWRSMSAADATRMSLALCVRAFAVISWLKCLVVADVSCAALTVVVGMSCFGPARLWSWLAIPFLVFLLARDAKAKKQYIKYVYLHGLWHLLSALATWAIVLDGGLPFGW